ncbi:MAG: DUF968 domain-containing protein [Aquamicrobium sp.]|nr:DUF968 domain-containing protein [Aquamicrobium sp.]
MAALGCIICGGPAEVHHLTGAGMGLKAANDNVIPLCPPHHRTGGYGVAVHAGTKEWERRHGTQAELLEKVRSRLSCSITGGWND